jgi:amidophosphoribosyltransferase
MTTVFDDKLHEECGVFGISPNKDASTNCVLGLHALQHRGQEACGIVTFDGHGFHCQHAEGHVSDSLNNQKVISNLAGYAAIGHVRYSTAGGSSLRNVQPVFAEVNFGGIAIAHNGNLTNADLLRKKLIGEGCIFQSSMDTEVIIHLIAISEKNNLIDSMIDALSQIEGAYSLVILTDKSLFAVRDPHGVRPLMIGKLNDSYVFASESCALDIIGAKYLRDVEPGEIVQVNGNELISIKPFAVKPKKFCIFEYVYFSRPDSMVDEKYVYNIRKNIGAELARESNIKADIVVPVPDSGVPSAIGYAYQSGIPFELGIIRNHYVGRTFIEPTDHVRHLGVKLKHNANIDVVKGKSIILIDDSIVRGTTSKKIVSMLREAGAKEIHMRIASPPTTNSCFYGVDTPDKSKLLAANYNIAEMSDIIGVDSLEFLSIDGLYRAVTSENRDNNKPQYCDACFTGEYPIAITDTPKDETKIPSNGKLFNIYKA